MITSAAYLSDYKIRFDFDDNDSKIVDFLPFLKESQNIMNNQFLSPERFKKFSIENGIISWYGPNGEMDFDQEHLDYINPKS